MDPAGGNFPAVLDRRTGPGGGIYTGNATAVGATNDHLIIFDGLGNSYNTSTNVAPLGMFVNGNSGGAYSYNAGAIVNVNGALFFPQDQYGNEFGSSSNSFSVELFFKTDGDMSQSGLMQLLMQGEGRFRYGLVVNEAGPGTVRFAIYDGTGYPLVDLTDRNYADGTWHYVLAVLDKSVGANGQLRLTVANEDGTDTNAVLNLPNSTTAPSNPGGNLFIGRNVFGLGVDSRPFLGLLDEIQMTSGVIATNQRIGRIPSIDGPAPVYVKPSIAAEPQSQTVVQGGYVALSVTAVGTDPLHYQWRKGGTPIAGATTNTLVYFPVYATDAGDYTLVVTNIVGAITSQVATLTVTNPTPIALWTMDPVGGNWPATFDTRVGPGQGVASGANGAAGLVHDDLGTFNGLGNAFVTSTDLPPLGMFVNNNLCTSRSYDAGALTNTDGALFFPQDQYGNELSFRGAFSAEVFFKTHGDQTAAGAMQLLRQAENSVRFTLSVNDWSSGGVHFAVNGELGSMTVDVVDHNYADGQWHYALAVYDPMAGADGELRLTVVNENGTSSSLTNALSAGFGPLPAGNDGNLFIGRNTFPLSADPRTFVGLINEIQVTAGVVQNSDRIGRIPTVDGPAPATIAPFICQQPASLTTLEGGVAQVAAVVRGTAVNYQWRRDGQNLPGATTDTLTYFPAHATNAGNYEVIASNGSGAVTTIVATVTVLAPYQAARWSMSPAGGNFPAVLDSRADAGQGIFTGNSGLPASADHLITFNDPAPHDYTTSSEVPPVAMFANGNNGGSYSFDAQALIAGQTGGALFYPQDQYGNEFSFRGAFSVELFFKTAGDQSAAGNMELLKQGEGWFRYGLIVNEAGAGSVRFIANNGTAIQSADLADRNYADGTWHYLLAEYDTTAGALRLTIVNADGSEATAITPVPAFGPLPVGNDGNLFIGKNAFNNALDPRTFLGLIDEIQITAGPVLRSARLGRIPSLDITITRIGVAGGNVTLEFTGGLGDTTASFAVQTAAVVNGTYSDVTPAATITQLSPGQFRAIVPVGGSQSYYRIRRR